MDRIAPTKRPDRVSIGTQKWRDLLFLHWPVEVAALRRLIPAGLEIDTFEDSAWVGVVPFAMHEIRTALMPRSLALDFLETNVRTYVHHGGEAPGVYFFSLDASSRLAVHAARLSFGLPYHYAEMSLRKDGGTIDYALRRRSRRAPRLDVRYSRGETLGPSPPGTRDHFFLERYYLYVERAGVLLRGQVHHPAYPRETATVHALEEDLVAASGLPKTSGAPIVHYASGVDVEIFGLELCGRAR